MFLFIYELICLADASRVLFAAAGLGLTALTFAFLSALAVRAFAAFAHFAGALFA